MKTIKINNNIYCAKQKDADTATLEKQIDEMVYKLYGLTYEKVKIISPEFTMSEAGYESFEVR